MERPILVDSHCHLNFPDFKDDLPDIIDRAHQAGVEYCLTVNTRLAEAEDLQKIASQYPTVFCSVGVHPHEAADYQQQDLIHRIQALAQHPKVIGIGETGLDYYYDHSPHQEQINCFESHINAAKELDLPLIIHTRNADDDTIACLSKAGSEGARGVFHCFSGTKELAKKGLDLGFYISLSGILTFKKADSLREVAKFVPLDRLLVETDSPYLAPIPHRGKRNEPAFTAYVAEVLSETKSIPLEEIKVQTTKNFFTLFNKAKRLS